MFYFQPILLPDGTLPYQMHLIGMWITFALCAMLISWHVMRTTKELRNREHVLAKAREKELQNQQIIALGTLATGAAHELSTPLSTIAILVPELESSCARSDEEKKDFQLLQSQVKLCRSILTDMLAKAGATRSESGKPIDLTEMLEQIVAKWKLLRPNIKSTFTLLNKNESSSPEIWADDTIRQTLLNLLNNAADVSPDWVNIEADWDQTQLSIVIEDNGPGLGSEAAKHVGKAFFTTRQDGMGLGIFLARATMRRFGGKILQMNRPKGGLKVTMVLPLAEITVSPSTGGSLL
jgi:two-component system sensor histidine kinase RegB